MLSNTTSAIETRRRAHRRQNSTPNIEVGQLRKHAEPGIQRAHSHRGHRRGLSLDQPRSRSPTKLTPTLGPISQDDIAVSINTTNPGPADQYRNTAVTQPSLARPGNDQFQFPGHVAIQPHDYPIIAPPNQASFQNISPQLIESPTNAFVPSPVLPMTPAQFQRQPTMQQINDLEQHIKSVFGDGEVQINILPTPVATPQKRASVALADNVDVPPIPFKFDNDNQFDPALVGQDFKPNLQSPESERGYESSFYSSPTHSVSCSPQQPKVKTFVEDLTGSQPFISEPVLFSSQTILTDVEVPIVSSPDSPDRSPRPVSIADLSIDGTIEDTGISNEEIQQYISPQDHVTHRWTCLFPGCEAKTFGRRENIRSHVQTHLGDRQYRCNHCGKCFVRQHDLKRHAKIHSGNKPYKCACGGGFARQDALTRHRQRGMCIGGFPNAIRKQARRGRPRKLRPDMEDRLEKAARTRDRANSCSSQSAGSAAEDSPSPPAHPDSAALDTAKLVDVPEDDEIGFGLTSSAIETPRRANGMSQSFSSQFDSALNATPGVYTTIGPADLAFTPPASSPAEIELANLASSSPILSQLLSASCGALAGSNLTATTGPADIHQTTPPSSPPPRAKRAPASRVSAGSDGGIFSPVEDPLALSLGLGMGITFSSSMSGANEDAMAPFMPMDYLKHEPEAEMSFQSGDDTEDTFRMWALEEGVGQF